MSRYPPLTLRRYLLAGQIPPSGCLRVSRATRQTAPALCPPRHQAVQRLHTSTDPAEPAPAVPFRKQLKDEAKRRKAAGAGNKSKQQQQQLDGWELTVGIEIHAQLNTACKLFSAAAATIDQEPNTHVALFDVAMPGSQPTFQKATLIPALRAALALNCRIPRTSRFDRKHYFHWDQPAGYQITQYYEPLAKDGHITLYAHDGIAREDGDLVRIGIKQIQMEQDTAKTVSQPGGVHLLDFNRVGLPLIEIITLPQIHHPSTAAALVRKIQILLSAVDACVLGMQSGGLRADVNVSVRRRDSGDGSCEYAGVKGLGQRTEIKNLSSFKAVEDAIIAERDRQISVLEAGGTIEGETRGWTIGSTETRRLRGKEGEVDYRYMPDPDLGPVIIADDLINHLQTNLPLLPDDELRWLVDTHGLTMKDAMSLVALDAGARVEYFLNVVESFLALAPDVPLPEAGRLCGNWVLHEMGGLKRDAAVEEEDDDVLQITSAGTSPVVHHRDVAALVHYLHAGAITGKTAKKVLVRLFEEGISHGSEFNSEFNPESDSKPTSKLTPKPQSAPPLTPQTTSPPTSDPASQTKTKTETIIAAEALWFTPLSPAEYRALANRVVDESDINTDRDSNTDKIVKEILVAGKTQKYKFLLGAMMRADSEGRVEPLRAEEVLREVVRERGRGRGWVE